MGNYKDNCLTKKVNLSESMNHSNISNMREQSSKNSDKIQKSKNSEDYINIEENIEIQINNKRKIFQKKNYQTIKINHKIEFVCIKYKFGEV